jgi:O-antigen/teichoic acid export membrane protein
MKKFELVRRALYIAVGQSFVKTVEFVAAIVLIRLLSPEDWSTVALALTIYHSATGLGGLNIQDGIYYFYARVDAHKRRALAVQTMGLLSASGVLVAAIVLGVGPWLESRGHAIGALIPWLSLAVLLDLPTSCASQLLVAAERPKWASIFDTSMAAIKLGAMTVPLALGYDVVASAQGLAAYAVLRLGVCAVLLPRVLPPGRARIELGFVKAQLVYTAPLSLSIATSVLNRYIDKWIVAGLAPDGFGAHAFAAQEVPFVPLLGFAMGTVLATRFAHAFRTGRRDRALSYWLAATSRVSLIVGPVTIGLILCAPEAVALLFEPSYSIAVLPFQIYSLILLHRVMAYGMILTTAGKTRLLWVTSLVMLGLNTLFSVPLTYFFGIAGAALGTMLAYVPNLVFFLHCIARVMQTSLAAVFPWRRYGRILGAALASAGLAFWAAGFAASTDARLAIKASVFALCYLLLARLFALGRDLPSVPSDDASFAGELGPVNTTEAKPAAA